MKNLNKSYTFILFLIVLAILPGGLLLAKNDYEITCGSDFIHRQSFGNIPPQGLQRMSITDKSDLRLTGATLNPGPALAANTDALAAFNRAIDTWISWFDDPVTIIITADLIPLGSTILGETESRFFTYPFTSVRDLMVTDADLTAEAICGSLPTLAQFNLILPSGFTFYNHEMSATKANFRALGYDMSFDDPVPDVEINFNSGMLSDFDFDRSNGIDDTGYDFEGVVLHELGHALGFSSKVHYVDWCLSEKITAEVVPEPLDLLRLKPGDGASDFTNSTRILVPANYPGGSPIPLQVTYTGTEDLPMSTGSFSGDGRQASHWKDNSLTGEYLGLMDPTMTSGIPVKPLKNDIVSLGLIGWDVGNGPCPGDLAGDCNNDGLTLSVADFVYMMSYLQGTASHLNNLCNFELNFFDNPYFPCEPTFGDYLYYALYFQGIMTFGEFNPECQFTEFPGSNGLNIVMPSNVDLSADLSETYTIQLENSNPYPLYVWSVTVPIDFPFSGGTGIASYTFTNYRDYGVWSVVDDINTSGKPALLFQGTEPMIIPALSAIDLFDVNYNWTYISGEPTMTADFFSESPACIPVISSSATPTGRIGGIRGAVWITESSLGENYISYACEIVPGDADGTPPLNILDIIHIINYIYKSGPPSIPYEFANADADGNCGIDILDIILLINYKYKNGPEPVLCKDWVTACGPLH